MRIKTQICKLSCKVEKITADDAGNIFFTTHTETDFQLWMVDGTTQQSKYLTSLAPSQTGIIGSILWYPDNCVFICMTHKHQIQKYDIATQTLSVFAGTGNAENKYGPITECSFVYPSDISCDKNGDLYVLAQNYFC